MSDSRIFDSVLECGFQPVIPEKVVDEVQSENEIAGQIIGDSDIEKSDYDRHEELSNRFFRLGKGELAVLVLGEEYSKAGLTYYCSLDDRRAREAADKLGLNTKGTIGILAELVSENALTRNQAEDMLRIMKSEGTHLPSNSVELLNESI